jgi:3-hydroxyacyl-CoA dehydrogenase
MGIGIALALVAAGLETILVAAKPDQLRKAEQMIAGILEGMVGEAYLVLHEGVATQSGDVDLVYLNGYGFPNDRGGPLWWAEQQVGLAHVERRMSELFELTGYASLDPVPVRKQMQTNQGH